MQLGLGEDVRRQTVQLGLGEDVRRWPPDGERLGARHRRPNARAASGAPGRATVTDVTEPVGADERVEPTGAPDGELAAPPEARPEDEAQLPADPTIRAHGQLLAEYLRTEPRDIVHVLRPLAALDEVIAVCESVTGGRQPPQPHDRTTLRSDVQQALTALGRELRRELEPTRSAYYHHEMMVRELSRAGEFDDAEEVLSFPPPRSAQVAWFIFANADIPDGYLRVGQVQFFSHRLWPEAVISREFMGRIPEAEFPAELDDWALEQIKPHDEAGAFVYARVELVGPRAQGSRNPWAHGRPTHEWACELVSGIVEAATFRLGGSAWKLLSGVAVYSGTVSDASGTFGNWSGSWPFADPDVYERPGRPLAEGTGEALESLEPRFAELLAEADETVRDAVREVRWYEAARQQADPAQRVVLHVRAFERALPTPGSERWNDAVKRYFREYWAIDRLEQEIFNLARQADWVVRHYRFDELERLEQWVVHEGERFTVFYAPFLRMAAQILPLIPQHYRLERRRLRQAVKWAADPAAARARIGEHEQRFDTLLDRALRQRNAVLHGVKTVPDVVASVDRFVARVAGYIVAQSVHGAGAGDDLVEAIERGRDHARRTLWRLDQGETPVAVVLFGVED